MIRYFLRLAIKLLTEFNNKIANKIFSNKITNLRNKIRTQILNNCLRIVWCALRSAFISRVCVCVCAVSEIYKRIEKIIEKNRAWLYLGLYHSFTRVRRPSP